LLVTSLFAADETGNRKVGLTIIVSQFTLYVPPRGVYTEDAIENWATSLVREAFKAHP
jgi:hypothetical protein